MRYLVLAADFDGTLARDGRVAATTLAALERVAATGRKLVLVTGRELDDLLGIFPGIGVFDRVVAENGALLYRPETGQRAALGDPPPEAFVRELERRGVAPLSVGKSIVATVHPNERIVLETIRDLGLELHVVFNKGAVMVLPATVNKASGLKAALGELGLSARNAVAIGDAENDHALLREAEYGVAVANAIPTLKKEADRTSARAADDAVVELIEDLVAHDLAKTPPRTLRRQLLLGARADGSQGLPAAGAAQGAGDRPSGRRQIGARHGTPRADRGGRLSVLRDRPGRRVRDFRGSGHLRCGRPGPYRGGGDHRPRKPRDECDCQPRRPAARRAPAVSPSPPGAARIAPRPHRTAALDRRSDEAHQLMPSEWNPAEALPTGERYGMVYVTDHPQSVAPAVLRGVDVVAALGPTAAQTVASVAAVIGASPPPGAASTANPGEALLWSPGGTESPFVIRVAPREAGRQ